MKLKMYDLTQPLSDLTPAWPTYEPLQVKFFKRLAPNGANGQLVTHSNHVGTHLDGSLHFCTHGRDIASIPLEELVSDGVIVDLSDIAEDYGIYTSKQITDRVEVRKGDILIINTGYHKYAWDQPESDELRYFVKHPGPDASFHRWALDMKIKWIGVDCGSADHPMNTIIRNWHPKSFIEAEKKLQAKFGKSWDEMFPEDEYYQVMHLKLFPKKLVHAENLGGEIDLVSNKRLWIGLFPLRGIEMESSMCRIIALEP